MRIFFSILCGLALLMPAGNASSDFLVISGATQRTMQSFMTIRTPNGQSFHTRTLQRLDYLNINDNDSIVYDFSTGRFNVYRSITPFDLLSLHTDFVLYNVTTDTAAYDFNTMFFNVGTDVNLINSDMTFTYVAYLRYGELINLTIDYDGDGVSDTEDAFPYDPNEWADNDGDWIGDNEDTDDDNDGMPDWWEIEYHLNQLVDDALDDSDGDGFSNIEEYIEGTDPLDRYSHLPRFMPWLQLLLGDD